MSPNRLQQAALIFIVGTILATLASGRWLLNGEMNIINALASFNTVAVQTGGIWGLPKYVIDFFSAIVTALSWNYPYLSSPWAIIVKIPLWLVSIGVIFGLVQIATTAVNGIVSGIRGLITPG
jgi:hypothetical protein